MHAEICPVCHGTGTVKKRNSQGTSNNEIEVTCMGCGGKGWVEVQDGTPYTPYNPYIPWYPTPYPEPVWITYHWSGHYDSAKNRWITD